MGIKLFLAQFMNTGIVIVLVAMRLPDVWNDATCVPGMDIEGVKCIIGPDGLFFKGNHRYMAPEWFIDVGAGVILTMIIQIFVANGSILGKWAAWLMLRCTQRGSAVTLSKMKKLYTGPQFDISKRMGEVLAFEGLVLFFSPGMPMVFFLGFVNFWVTYQVDRWTLLRFYASPPVFDSKLIAQVAKQLPPLVVFHLAMAFVVYARQPGLSLSDANASGAEQFEQMNNSTLARDLGPLNVAGNITNVSSLFFFITFIVYVVYYLIKNLPVLAPLKMVITIVWKMLCTKKKKVAPDAEGTDGDLPCFSDALKGCKHEQLRVLSDSAETIVGPEALAPKERHCLNVNDIFFKLWGLKKDAPKIDLETWKAAK